MAELKMNYEKVGEMVRILHDVADSVDNDIRTEAQSIIALIDNGALIGETGQAMQASVQHLIRILDELILAFKDSAAELVTEIADVQEAEQRSAGLFS